MTDVFTMLAALRRPKILIRAARIGVLDYHRDTHLRRLLGYDCPKTHSAAILALLDYEAEVNQLRLDNSAAYQPARHVEIVIALMGEARLLRASHPKV